MALISLAMFGYLLFFTVYRQMIDQNEGFFYVIVFGGILVLAFILLSLMTKLLAFSHDVEDSVGFIILEVLLLLTFSVLFVRLRISYGSSVPVEESICFHTADLIKKGTISVGGMDIMPELLRKPASFLMGALVSLFLDVTQDHYSLMIYINSILLLGCAFFAYGIVRRIGSRICSIFVFLITLFMPSLTFSVYTYDAQLLFAFVLLLAVFLSVIPMTREKLNAASIVASIFAGVLWGLVLFMEPVSVLILLFVLFLGRIGKMTPSFAGLIFAIAVFCFFGYAFMMSSVIDQPLSEILPHLFMRFNPFSDDSGNLTSATNVFANFNDKINAQAKAIADNSYFLTKSNGATYTSVQIAWMQLGSQILYMFLLILSIACAFYMIRSRNGRILPILTAIISGYLMIFFSSGNEYNFIFFLMLIIMTGGISLQYMYENHHALADENLHKMLGDEEEEFDVVEEEVEETEEEKAAFLARAQALIFVGMNEEYYKQIKLAEQRQAKKRISAERTVELPLPETVPVKEEEPAKVEETVKTDEIRTEETKKEETKKKEIEYLENPLPVPKKHTPKELNFDRVDLGDDDSDDFRYDLQDEDDDWEFDLDEDI